MVMVLRDDTTGIYVWSESFRLGLNNWFEAQQRVIRRIATSLNVQLSAERLMRLAGEPDVRSMFTIAGCAGRVCTSNTMRKAGSGRSLSPRCYRKIPTYSPAIAASVQLNNIEHLFTLASSATSVGKGDA